MQFTAWGDRVFLATLSDSVDDPKGPFSAILVPSSANISFLPLTGDVVSLRNWTAGIILLPIRRIRVTGTQLPNNTQVYGICGLYPQASL